MTRPRTRSASVVASGTMLGAAVLAGCVTTSQQAPPQQAQPRPASPAAPASAHPTPPTPPTNPAVGAATGVLPYAAAGPGQLSGAARQARPLVYVPNQQAGTVQVIDPATYTITATYPVARSPEHVVPSHDLSTLWVNSDAGNTLTAIDPATGTIRASVPVDDPYNLYFTPDGSAALVMAERLQRIDVRDPATMTLRRSLPVPCRGVNHADVTADLTTMLVSCEFTGQLLVLDANATAVRTVINLNSISTPGSTTPAEAAAMGGPMAWLERGANSMPQDVRLAPDGSHLLVADMMRNGVWILDAATMTVARFQPTGKGAHGIYPSRDASAVYVSNRGEGSITVLDAHTLTPTATWWLPGGASPDMGGVTADGGQLWLSGRYSSAVYVIDTHTGTLLHTIAVRPGPHGLLVWPQPGRFSLGHTGNMR